MAATVTPFSDRLPDRLSDWRPFLPFDPALPPAERCGRLAAAFPDILREVLNAGRVERRACFAEDAFAGVSEHWHPPPTVTGRQAAAAQRALDEVERTILAPAPPAHLLARILALLSHYPAKGLTPEVEQMVALDWSEDLGEFPSWAIDHAARVWRRTKKWRPSIAEIRTLCEDACARERALAERLRAVARAGTAPAVGAGAVRNLARPAVRRMP